MEKGKDKMKTNIWRNYIETKPQDLYYRSEEDSKFEEFIEFANGNFGYMAGVFDGHTGDEYANYCALNTCKIFVAKMNDILTHSSVKKICAKNIQKTFCFTFRLLELKCHSSAQNAKRKRFYEHEAGTTLVVILLTFVDGKPKIFCANSGDSNCNIYFNTDDPEDDLMDYMHLSQSHCAGECKSEEQRINGHVYFNRVLSVVEPSRGVGDFFLKGYIIPEPVVTEMDLCKYNTMVLLGSDGVFDTLSGRKINRILSKMKDEKDLMIILKRLGMEVVRGFGYLKDDDATVVLIRFKNIEIFPDDYELTEKRISRVDTDQFDLSDILFLPKDYKYIEKKEYEKTEEKEYCDDLESDEVKEKLKNAREKKVKLLFSKDVNLSLIKGTDYRLLLVKEFVHRHEKGILYSQDLTNKQLLFVAYQFYDKEKMMSVFDLSRVLTWFPESNLYRLIYKISALMSMARYKLKEYDRKWKTVKKKDLNDVISVGDNLTMARQMFYIVVDFFERSGAWLRKSEEQIKQGDKTYKMALDYFTIAEKKLDKFKKFLKLIAPKGRFEGL